ncbi:MAG: right-handed parallel beta-helix repeat-containing protein [Actinomycetota bacterium]|nr:right-handed parallel beta-helix repeat-containing protein [Actinomycetota bacterium]
MLLAGAVGVAAASPAAASPASSIGCGATITKNTILTADVGPCLRGNGLNVTGSNIIVDLNGHKIIGSHGTVPLATREQVGVNLANVKNDTIKNGTVELFDAGVSILHGSGNTVTQLVVRHNVSVNLLEPTNTTDCNFGDGIIVDFSNSNTISYNTVSGNGPFDGIALVDVSGHNLVSHNKVLNNDLINLTTTGGFTLCGGQALQAGFARPIQDMGIRIEGPGATDNTLVANTVTNSALYGIEIQANFCGAPPVTSPPNTHNLIENNVVTLTGSNPAVYSRDQRATGIGTIQQGDAGVVCPATNNAFIGNISSNNRGTGIELQSPSSGNTVYGNITQNNGRDGLFVQGPQKAPTYGGFLDSLLKANVSNGNGVFDAADFNDHCSATTPPPRFPANSSPNRWLGDSFGTINEPCVGGGGKVTQVLLQNDVYTGPQVAPVTSPPGLMTPWTDDVTVANAHGFILYSDTACTVPVGSGTGVASGNMTTTPTISFASVTGAVAFTIAGRSVIGVNTPHNPPVPNAAIGCTVIGSGSQVPGL